MTSHIPYYISRKPAEEFLAKFATALEQPQSNPLLFHVYGFGGVGKTSLTTKKLKEAHESQTDFAEVSFGRTPGIENPLKLMSTLYKQLPKPNLLRREILKPDPFLSLYEQYQQTLTKLKTQPVKGEAVDAEQQSTVKEWFELGSLTLLAVGTNIVNPIAATGLALDGIVKAGRMLSDTSQAIAPTKERVQQLLQEHPATKKDKELQALMFDPIATLTRAFVEGCIQKTQQRKQAIVFILDTYEKAPSDIDTWLWQYLLQESALQSHSIRLVVAGRRCLLEKEEWRKLQQDRDVLYERRLDKFDKEQTAAYLQQVGITKGSEIQKIYKVTKGLPYYLNWIRREKEAGRNPDFSRGNQAIVDLLLQGLNAKQKQIVQLAACCRWFDRPLIEYLMQRQGIDFQTAADPIEDCFEWLKKRDFVEFVQGRYRLDDVARDVFRLSLVHEDKNQFRNTHELLARYFEKQANQEVSPESTPAEKYETLEWRQYTAEFLYHLLIANRDEGQRQFVSHLFAARYLNQFDIIWSPFAGVAADAEAENNGLLPSQTAKFVKSIRLVFWLGWNVLNKDPASYKINYGNGIGPSTEEIEAALRPCFDKVDSLDDGLGKWAGLVYKSLRYRTLERRLELLLKAKEQAEKIATTEYPEFSSRLLSDVGAFLLQLSRHEQGLYCCDSALKLYPNSTESWNNRGVALNNLEFYEEAVSSFEKALAIKPNLAEAWIGRGSALGNLERYEEAIASSDKALEIKPNFSEAWFIRGGALLNLGCYEEAIASWDKALEIKPDYPQAWANRGVTLSQLGLYKEAVDNCDKALAIKPDFPEAWSFKGLALSFLCRYDEAVDNHKEAVKLQPEFPLWWANRGIVLARARRYEEALASCDKAIELNSKDETGYYGKACCYALQGDSYMALENLQRAIELKPQRCRREAKTNPDFDSLRKDPRFQQLLQEQTD